jgi:hypothetical protein
MLLVFSGLRLPGTAAKRLKLVSDRGKVDYRFSRPVRCGETSPGGVASTDRN